MTDRITIQNKQLSIEIYLDGKFVGEIWKSGQIEILTDSLEHVELYGNQHSFRSKNQC